MQHHHFPVSTLFLQLRHRTISIRWSTSIYFVDLLLFVDLLPFISLIYFNLFRISSDHVDMEQNTRITVAFLSSRRLIWNKAASLLAFFSFSQIQMTLFGVWSQVWLRASLLVQCAATHVETGAQCMNMLRRSTPSRPATPAPSVLEGSALLWMPSDLTLFATMVLPGDLSPNKHCLKHECIPENRST